MEPTKFVKEDWHIVAAHEGKFRAKSGTEGMKVIVDDDKSEASPLVLVGLNGSFLMGKTITQCTLDYLQYSHLLIEINGSKFTPWLVKLALNNPVALQLPEVVSVRVQLQSMYKSPPNKKGPGDKIYSRKRSPAFTEDEESELIAMASQKTSAVNPMLRGWILERLAIEQKVYMN